MAMADVRTDCLHSGKNVVVDQESHHEVNDTCPRCKRDNKPFPSLSSLPEKCASATLLWLNGQLLLI